MFLICDFDQLAMCKCSCWGMQRLQLDTSFLSLQVHAWHPSFAVMWQKHLWINLENMLDGHRMYFSLVNYHLRRLLYHHICALSRRQNLLVENVGSRKLQLKSFRGAGKLSTWNFLKFILRHGLFNCSIVFKDADQVPILFFFLIIKACQTCL